MQTIRFMKMSGSGNDFIIIDNRDPILSGDDLPRFVARVCARRVAVGADGLILIEPSSRADFKWRFFNADGSEAAFCGNGSRCVARYAHMKKISGETLSFETTAGIIQAWVKGETVKVSFPQVTAPRLDLQIPLDAGTKKAHFIQAGVPHVVCPVTDLDQTDVLGMGREIRYHTQFQPAGTNVNFVKVADPYTVQIRTYERGVEGETLACGSGAVASALILAVLGRGRSPLRVVPRSGESLQVTFHQDGTAFSEVFLEGEARVVYEGELCNEAWRES